VDADEDTYTEVGGDVVTGPEASSAVKPKHKTKAAVAKQSAMTAAANATAMKAVVK
jgi:hypothetical protein